MSGGRRPRGGLTLVEMLVVLAVLVGVAALVVPLVGNTAASAKETVTRANMTSLRDALVGPYRVDMSRRLPRPGAAGIAAGRPNAPQARYLYVNPGLTTPAAGADNTAAETTARTFNPATALGWRGPYLAVGFGTYRTDTARGFTATYGQDGDPCVVDGWNQPLVIVERNGGANAELRSAGPDGILTVDDNTRDDVVLPLY